jgi:myo-inositol-1(or 4)-monophosphatase
VSDDLLDVAITAARRAGTLLRERFEAGTERTLRTKSSPTDLVSDADLTAERTIRELIVKRRPADAILGEEGDDIPGTSGRRWIVDPLDGTVNFLYGIPQWAVSIACDDEVGVIYDPMREELFVARRGGAPTLNGVPLEASRCELLETAMVATGFGYEASVREAQAAVVARALPRVRDIRRMGSAALDLAWTAAGRYDAFYERGVKAWDTAAGELLCASAGLEVRRLQARGDLPAGVLAAPAGLMAPLLELVG